MFCCNCDISFILMCTSFDLSSDIDNSQNFPEYGRYAPPHKAGTLALRLSD